jgi:hypothetical protein
MGAKLIFDSQRNSWIFRRQDIPLYLYSNNTIMTIIVLIEVLYTVTVNPDIASRSLETTVRVRSCDTVVEVDRNIKITCDLTDRARVNRGYYHSS